MIDIRNIGLIGAIELAAARRRAGTRALRRVHSSAFHEQDLLIRVTGDIIALSPPLIVEQGQIDEMFGKLRKVLETLD